MSFRGTISWKSSQGILLLGISQTNKTLLLKPGGEAVPGPFDLQHKLNYWRPCLIEDPLNGEFILTGGGEKGTSKNVIRYGENGYIEHLFLILKTFLIINLSYFFKVSIDSSSRTRAFKPDINEGLM